MFSATDTVDCTALLRRMADTEQERFRSDACQAMVNDMSGAHPDLRALMVFHGFEDTHCMEITFQHTNFSTEAHYSRVHSVRIGRDGRILTTESRDAVAKSVRNALSQFAATSFYNCGALAVRDPRIQHDKPAKLVLSVQLIGACPDWTWPDIYHESPLKQASVVHRVLGDYMPDKIGLMRVGDAPIEPTMVIRVALGSRNAWIGPLRAQLDEARALLGAAVAITAQVRDNHIEVELFDAPLESAVECIFSAQFVKQFVCMAK